jgi:hypothetical protein
LVAETSSLKTAPSREESIANLFFDIGSHVGDRIGSFRRLGCRTVSPSRQRRS